MKFSRKIKVVFLIALAALAIGYYFINYFPVGTYLYHGQNDNDLNIKIRISEQLGSFQEPVYNMSITIKNEREIYTTKYTTSDNTIYFAALSRNKKKFVVIDDLWKGCIKCEDGNCGDVFNAGIKSYGVDNATNDTIYLENYADTLKADTLSYIEFKDFKFRKLK